MNNKRVPPSVAQFAVSERAELLARSACLEGEIAKRDVRIVELQRYEHAFNEWHDKTEWVQAESATLSAKYLGCHRADVMRSLIDDLRAELAACRVAVENCEVFRARIAELEADRDSHQRCAIQAMAELAAIKAQEPVAHDTKGSRKALGAMNAKLKAKIGRLERELAAPAAKPQVVIPELDREGFEDEYSGEYGTPVSVLRLLRDGENYIEKPQHSDRLNSSWWMWKVALSRLNAAPSAGSQEPS